MSIEFLFDEHHEEQQEKLKKILEVIKRKHFKVDKRARFLRKFTLSCMGQYPKPAMLKHHQEMMKQLKEGSVVQKLQQKQIQQKMPMPPKQVVFEIPNVAAPEPVRLMPEVPRRI